MGKNISKDLNMKIFSSSGDEIKWKLSHIAGRKLNWNSILIKQFCKCKMFPTWLSNSSSSLKPRKLSEMWTVSCKDAHYCSSQGGKLEKI